MIELVYYPKNKEEEIEELYSGHNAEEFAKKFREAQKTYKNEDLLVAINGIPFRYAEKIA